MNVNILILFIYKYITSAISIWQDHSYIKNLDFTNAIIQRMKYTIDINANILEMSHFE